MAERFPGADDPVHELVGDLFAVPASSSLAHCVSADLRMGRGIAVQFKKRFGRVGELKSQLKEVGEFAVLKEGSRFVYYLVTKEKFSGKPKLASLKASLLAMRAHCVANGVAELSMPRIGCGLDGFDWSDIRPILSEVFRDTQTKVCVYNLS